MKKTMGVRKLFVTLILASLSMASLEAGDTPINLPFFGCKFKVPEQWLINKLDRHSKAAFVIDNPAGGKFVLTVTDVKQQFDANTPEFGEAIKDELKKQGYTITRSVVSEFRGHSAFVVDGTVEVLGKTQYAKSITFMVGTTLYNLSLGKFEGKPDTDPEYLTILESFELSR